MARTRAAPPARQQGPMTTGRQALKEKTNTARARAPVYEDDGVTDHLVKNARPKRGRPKKVQQDSDEFMMAGGLGLQSEDPLQQQSSEMPATTDEPAKHDYVPPVLHAKTKRRPARVLKKVVQSETQAKILEGLKQRMESTAQGQRAKPAAAPIALEQTTSSSDGATIAKLTGSRPSDEAASRSSEISISPSPPLPGKLSAVKARPSTVVQPGSVLKVHNTPAIETSMLALKNFKRRPRQPSMLQMVQQRTASARPSLARAPADSTAIENATVFDLDLDDSQEEDDFSPEAEGTPLNAKTKRTSVANRSRSSTASSTIAVAQPKPLGKKRKSDKVGGSLAALQVKRRKSDGAEAQEEAEVDQAPPSPTRLTTKYSSDRAGTPQALVTCDVQVAKSPITSTSPTGYRSPVHLLGSEDDYFVIPSTERAEVEAEAEPPGLEDHEEEMAPLNGTMADPLSSSPVRSFFHTTTNDDLADPTTQISPSPEKSKPQKAKPLFTATLQSLLPRRRQAFLAGQRKSQYDMDSESDTDEPIDVSHLDDDEDELGGRVRRQTKTKTPLKSKRGKASEAAVNARKPTVAPTTKRSVPKTYGRATISDKENEAYESPDEEAEDSTLPDVSISMQEAVKSKEVEDAKKKFADIDDWDMEFESMSAEHHRSSSQDWR